MRSRSRHTASAVELLWNKPSVMARLEETEAIERDVAEALGMVGPAARACGLARDVRQDHPSGIFRFAHVPVSTWGTGKCSRAPTCVGSRSSARSISVL